MADDHTPPRPKIQSAIIRFHGYEISSWRDERTADIYASIPGMCRGIGIGENKQIPRLKSDPLYCDEMQRGFQVEPPRNGSRGGGLQDPWGLNIRKVEMWLASINAKLIKNPEVKARLLMFQRECAEVLHGYWEGLPQQRRDVPRQQQDAPHVQSVRVQYEEATAILKAVTEMCAFLNTPEHVVHQIAAKEIFKEVGLDISLLLTAPVTAREEIDEEKMMLEPRALSAYFLGDDSDAGGARINRYLASLLWQYKIDKVWHATDKGKPLCIRQPYLRNGHRGYNYCWYVAKVREGLETLGVIPKQRRQQQG